jgi:hypothetical protein
MSNQNLQLMKKFTFLLAMLSFIAFNVMAQEADTLEVVGWVGMDGEPNYMENPYDKPTYTAMPTPDGWEYDPDNFDFDAAWNAVEDADTIAKPTNTSGGDLFDLGDGDTYGAMWKAMYDDSTVYVLMKWVGTTQADEGSVNMEVMFQPNYPRRFEPQIDSFPDNTTLQKHAYGRFVELGGGKAKFAGGSVTECAASIGLERGWGDNEHALEELAVASHYWNTEQDTTKALMVLPIEALSYPKDPFGDLTDRESLDVTPGKTKIAWEMKSNITVNDERVEYCWSSDQNNVYAMNYYAGYLKFGRPAGAIEKPLRVVNWVNMANEPDYMGNPYDKPTYTAMPAPEDWNYDAENLDFDAAWNAVEDADTVAKPTNTSGGDLFDLGDGNTYGTTWKAMYDDTTVYVLFKWIGTTQADEGSVNMEVMFQPNYPRRFEPQIEGFPGDSINQKHAYGRFVELGGGKAKLADGTVTECAASLGTDTAWGDNEHALEKLAVASHFWNQSGDTTKAVMALPIEALSYPTDPFGDLSDRTSLDVTPGETKIAWEMKANITVNDERVEYCWSGDHNNVYAMNYYAGYLKFGEAAVTEQVATPTFDPAGGEYNEAQDVTISTSTEDATIYYTTDGSDPDDGSTEYTGAITVDEDMTIKAIAYKDGMDPSDIAEAEYTIVTGLDDVSESNIMSIYPNPVKEEALVKLDSKQLKGDISLKVYDYTGHVVIDEQVVTNNNHRLNMSELPAGIYLIEVASDNLRSVQKIVKQ